MSASTATLVLFCKPPHRSKRRLAPVLGEQATAELARHLLGCALEDAAAWPGPVVLSPAHEDDTGWAERLPLPSARVLPQVPGNLGARLNDIDLRLRDEGHDRLLFIGADCPQLDTGALLTAADALAVTDVVLGRADDGGVVFMGNAVSWPELADLPWSSGSLGVALAGACERAGLRVGWHGGWPDVDRVDEVVALAADLASDRRPARRRLRAWLEDREWSTTENS